jgi:hypothetical protein
MRILRFMFCLLESESDKAVRQSPKRNVAANVQPHVMRRLDEPVPYQSVIRLDHRPVPNRITELQNRRERLQVARRNLLIGAEKLRAPYHEARSFGQRAAGTSGRSVQKPDRETERKYGSWIRIYRSVKLIVM